MPRLTVTWADAQWGLQRGPPKVKYRKLDSCAACRKQVLLAEGTLGEIQHDKEWLVFTQSPVSLQLETC